jgi:hypothetical protein
MVEIQMEEFFFVSYSRLDSKFVDRFIKDLLAHGISIWRDINDIPVGETVSTEIAEALRLCKGVLAIISDNSKESRYVSDELNIAYTHEKTIIPIFLHDTELPPDFDFPIRAKNYIKMYPDSYEENLPKLIDDIKAIKSESDGEILNEQESLREPLPAYDPDFILKYPAGAERINSPFYIIRNADQILNNQILGQGTTTTIQAGRQTGKTSLLLQGVQTAKSNNVQVVYFDFQEIGKEQLESLNSLLYYLTQEIVLSLALENKIAVESIWNTERTPITKFNQVWEKVLCFDHIPLILLSFDEADKLLSYPYKDEFFGLIRAWDTHRAFDEKWQKLNVVMVISTYPFLLIENINQSPFNIGAKIDLEDFNKNQINELNIRYRSPLKTNEIEEFKQMFGGHPFLSRLAFYSMVNNEMNWNELSKYVEKDYGPFKDHLEHHWQNLIKEETLLNELKNIIQYEKIFNQAITYRLEAAGIIKAKNFRCELYKIFFGDKLK